MQRINVLIIGILSATAKLISALFFPASSVFQITISISVPVIDLPSDRRVFFDWGLQMNHDLPAELSSFYDVPIWPDLWNNTNNDTARLLAYENKWKEYFEPLKYSKFYQKYERRNAKRTHYQDFTAGELYRGLEHLLVSHDFHASCLPLSVCELARHPFSDQQQNILTEIVTFLLTPSFHMGFDDSEQFQRDRFENAELRGFMDEDCAYLYSKCETNVLGLLSKVVF